MSTTRDPDRLVLFTDAVVAIAITLLVLPLVEAINTGENPSAAEVITHHQPQIYSFVLSFAVIAQLWLTHHRLFEGVKAYDSRLMLLNMVWLLTIVWLPFPTGMIGRYGTDTFTVLLYIGTILVSSVILAVLTLMIQGSAMTARSVLVVFAPPALLLIALVVAALVPAANYYTLLLLALVPLIRRFATR